MWPSLIAKAKKGGLDVIQTYVFWNLCDDAEMLTSEMHGPYTRTTGA